MEGEKEEVRRRDAQTWARRERGRARIRLEEPSVEPGRRVASVQGLGQVDSAVVHLALRVASRPQVGV